MASLTQLLRHGCLIRSAFAFLFLIQSIFAFSQSFGGNTDLNIPDTKRIYMKINPLSVLFGSIPGTSEYGLRFEIVANKRFTYQLGAGYLGNTILYQTNLVTDSARAILKQYQFPGIRLQGELRYYFLKTKMDKSLNNYLSPSGMYIALQSSYSTATFSAKVSNFQKKIGRTFPSVFWVDFNSFTKRVLVWMRMQGLAIKELQPQEQTIDPIKPT